MIPFRDNDIAAMNQWQEENIIPVANPKSASDYITDHCNNLLVYEATCQEFKRDGYKLINHPSTAHRIKGSKEPNMVEYALTNLKKLGKEIRTTPSLNHQTGELLEHKVDLFVR